MIVVIDNDNGDIGCDGCSVSDGENDSDVGGINNSGNNNKMGHFQM